MNKAWSAILLLVSGCAEISTVYHRRAIDPVTPQALTVDAYQRSTYFSKPKGKDEEMRVCAEAAPDTFAALSASIAGEGDVKTQKARIAAALSQTGATIERTQTINLLRESLYRTCERYLSDAIDKATLVVQAARDQRMMVSVLAIEQLTRTIRPPATIISAGATNAMVPNQGMVDLIVATREERDQALKGASAAAASFASANETVKCVGTTAAPEGADAATWASCKAKEAEAATAKSAADRAETRLDQVLRLSGGGGGATSAGTDAGPSDPGGSEQASPQAVQAVADAVYKIATAPGLNESLMFCIGYLSKKLNESIDRRGVAGSPNEGVWETCQGIVKARALEDDYLVTRTVVDNADIAGGTGGEGGTKMQTVPVSGPTSGIIMRRYLFSAGRATERRRRMALAQAALGSSGKRGSASMVNALVMSGTDAQQRDLLTAITPLETRPEGKEILLGQ